MRGYMGGPGTSSKDFTWKIFHDIITCVRFSINNFQDIMTFTLFQKTEEIEFSRGCLHFLSSAHTSDGPISNRAFSQDNWTLYPSLTHFNNMRRDIPTTRAHSIISHISYSEINLLLHYAVQFWSRPLFLQTGSPGRWCWYSLQTSTS